MDFTFDGLCIYFYITDILFIIARVSKKLSGAISLEMETVKIKTEPLDADEDFDQIIREEVIIKSESEMDYTSPPCEEPEEQLMFKSKEDIEIVEPPPEPVTPTRSQKNQLNYDSTLNHCTFCNMFFKCRTSLKLHERNCNQKNDCHLCGHKFVTSYALNTHVNKIHNRRTKVMKSSEDSTNCKIGRPPNTIPNKGLNQCDICSLEFSNTRNLNNHKKKHNTCQQCGEHFKVHDELMNHLCPNAAVKVEIEEQYDLGETPKNTIFKATTSTDRLVSKPIGENFNAAENEDAANIANDNLTINSKARNGFSVVTKDTDFEAFVQQMLIGFTKNSKASINGDEVSRDIEHEVIAKEEIDVKDDVTQLDDAIFDRRNNDLKHITTKSIDPAPLIKEEPMDYDDQPTKPLIPFLLPFIKDERQDPEQNPNEDDFTDFLLEELFDRKLKSLAKVQKETKFNSNGLGFKVKKEIPLQKHPNFGTKNIHQAKKSTSGKKFTKQSDEINSKSKRKAGPHKIREDISENLTPPLEKNNIVKEPSTVQPRKELKSIKESKFQPLLTLKDKNSGEPPIKHQRKNYLQTKPLPQYEIKSENNVPAGFVNYDTILAESENNLIADDGKIPAPFVKSELDNSLKDDNQHFSLKNDGETNQPLLKVPDIPMDAEIDFEEAIQSNMLPNIKHVDHVIKSLTEEYKKAEQFKRIEPILEPPVVGASSTAMAPLDPAVVYPTLENGEDKKLSPEAIEARNRPCSLFFPMLDDTQVYNMVANALHEKYRYVWICPICPRQYTNIRPFKKHLLTIHFRSKEELEGKSFELRPELVFESTSDETFCHLCHVNLADNMSLRKHQIELHKEQDLTLNKKKKPLLHKCYICSKLCSTRSILAEHMKSDCGNNPQYACNVCDKKFHTKSTLNLHKTMHTGELPHSCSFCQKRFRTRGQLTVHTRTHTGEKPFPCKVCGQRFTHRETLIAHLSRHIDMKRYKCYGCDQFFSCISGLKTHRTTRPQTCGLVKLNARAVGPRVRVIKGNVIFEPQPVYNARLLKSEKNYQESYILDHNYHIKDPNHHKKVPKQTAKSDVIVVPQ